MVYFSYQEKQIEQVNLKYLNIKVDKFNRLVHLFQENQYKNEING